MKDFIAYNLNFLCAVKTALYLPRYNGSNLRGAFFSALRQDFCLNKNLDSCLHCPTAEVCPICRLVATIERENNRGAEIPRPFALKPIIDGKTQFTAGETFNFGITIFGKSLNLFPYAILAVQRMGETGVGNRHLAPGDFIFKEARAVNPLTGRQKTIYSDSTRVVNVPEISINNEDILNYAGKLDSSQITLNMVTPLRLVIDGSLVQKLNFRVFLQRLLRRLTDLAAFYGARELELDFVELLKKAEEIQTIRDNTRWIDLSSYSSRRQAGTPTGGLMGEITFQGNLKEFLPLLVWGQITHVGKDATRGNGWYTIS